MNFRIQFNFFGIPVNIGGKVKEPADPETDLASNELKGKYYRIIPIGDKEEERVKKTPVDSKSKIVKGPKKGKKDTTEEVSHGCKIQEVGIDKKINFSLDLEKIRDKGEDAPAVILRFEDNSMVLAVADGLGGAGGTTYEIDGRKLTGAYLASRAINAIIKTYFIDFKEKGNDISLSKANEIIDDLKDAFKEGIKQILDKIDRAGNPPSKIKGRLVKKLPTTFALSYLKINRQDIEIFNYWVGDSRIYTLNPIDGLHQLTIDDLRSKLDAFENLYSDSAVSNVISADNDYHINCNFLVLNGVQIVFASTDGAFAYLPTPVHFEYLLIRTMISSSSTQQWKNVLQEELIKNQSDDISISLSIIGINSYDELRQMFKRRYEVLKEDLIDTGDYVAEIKKLESSIRIVEEQNAVVNVRIANFETQLENASNYSKQIEREIDNSKFEIREIERQINIKRNELNSLEDKQARLKDDLEEKSYELNGVEEKIRAIEKDANDFRKEHPFVEVTSLRSKLSKETEDRKKGNLALWKKYKDQYEKYLK